MENLKKIFEEIKNVFPEKREVKHESIKKLSEPIKRLLEQLRGRIDAGAYRFIIGDDASGRIPTLIFNKVLKAIYEKKGHNPPETIFFAGSGSFPKIGEEKELKKENLQAYLERLLEKKHLKQEYLRALVVTDIIESGNSLKPLADALRANGMKFDFATIASFPSKEEKEKKVEKLGGEIFTGTGISGIYGRHYLSGVKKDSKELFSVPYEYPEGNKEELEEARKDVKVLSEDLTHWYFEKNI